MIIKELTAKILEKFLEEIKSTENMEKIQNELLKSFDYLYL